MEGLIDRQKEQKSGKIKCMKREKEEKRELELARKR